MSDTETATADSVTSPHTEQTVAASFYLIDKDNLERYRQNAQFIKDSKNELDNLKINFLFNGKKFIEDAIRNMMIEVKG